MRERLSWSPWTRWRDCWTDRGRGARSCCARAWIRPGRCASRTRRRSTLGAVVRGEAWVVPDDGEAVRLGRGDVAILRGPGPLHGRRRPGHAAAGRHPPRPALHDARRRGPRRDDGPRRPHLGQQPGRRDACCSPAPTRWTARSAGRLLRALPPLLVLPDDAWDSPAGPAARRRDRQGRAGPGGGARPAARPAADRRPAGLVRAARGRGARPGTAPTPTRWSGPALRLLHNNPAHPWTVAELAPGDRRRPGRRSPGASTSWSASRR